jgi:cell division FtsZ-interacting protein ZapD
MEEFSPCLVGNVPLQVNIIPVIAKADTISKSELHKFKLKIMSELVSNGVQIYQFPTDDETVSSINSAMNVSTGCCSENVSFPPFRQKLLFVYVCLAMRSLVCS